MQLSFQFFWLTALLVSSLQFVSVSASNAKNEPATKSTEDHAQAMITWVRSKGGYVNDKLEIRRRDPINPNSPTGVFARFAVSKNETLLQIPRSCYLGLDPDQMIDTSLFENEDTPLADAMQVYFANGCKLAHKIMDELALFRKYPGDSHYKPFLDYIEAQPMGQLPATYTKEGKALLRTIMGPIEKDSSTTKKGTTSTHQYNLPPWQLVDWIDRNFIETDCIAANDRNAEHAAALVVQRGYDSELIPIWDMVNHDNAQLNVDTSSLRSDEGVTVWASTDIAAGEEIFATYNYCHDCYEIGDYWGTPGIFRDFGFVEGYPQVWPFFEHDRTIWFEVDYDSGDTGELKATFDEDEAFQTMEVPDDEGLAFLRDQLARLEHLDLEKEKGDRELPSHEWFMIQEYHRTMKVALKAGIAATLEKRRSEDEEQEL